MENVTLNMWYVRYLKWNREIHTKMLNHKILQGVMCVERILRQMSYTEE